MEKPPRLPRPRTIVECFEGLPDPRLDRARAHKLTDILIIGLRSMPTIGGGFTDMEFLGRAQAASAGEPTGNYGRDWPASAWLNPSGPSGETAALSDAIICRAFRRALRPLRALSEGAGAWRTNCISLWMSPFGKTNPARAPATPRRTWPRFAVWPSTWSRTTKPGSCLSDRNACSPPWITAASNNCSVFRCVCPESRLKRPALPFDPGFPG